MTSMTLSRLHYPVRNLGYGQRAGIWFQGCTVYCRGCISRDTWAFDDARTCDVDAVLTWLDTLDGTVDGVTISGGEPTDQPEALRVLLDALTTRRETADILLYSGRSTQHLQRAFPWLWDLVDVLISEPYDDTQSGDCALRGSANQRVHLLSPLARHRYPEDSFEETYAIQRQQISIRVDDRSVWMVGIPKPGDLARLRSSLERRGVEVGRTSWLS
jgi:anaerobic ribonucleoside-triphosphate reductase activating protein